MQLTRMFRELVRMACAGRSEPIDLCATESEITHRTDPATGRFVQVVSPGRLRELLRAKGESFERPDFFFSADDEWKVTDD